MKHNAILILIVFLFSQVVWAQGDCSKFYPMEEGTTFQLTTYDKKDKPTSVIDYLIKASSVDAAIISYEVRDKKGELMLNSEYEITCENDGISIDFKSLAAPGMMEQYKDMEIDLTGTNLYLPNDMSEGQTLPDADLLMNVSMSAINMKLTVKIFDRQVVGEETVTTPAGTFNCMVLRQNQETKMGMTVKGSSKEWYAPEVGLVKQETYGKNGKKIASSVLTAFN